MVEFLLFLSPMCEPFIWVSSLSLIISVIVCLVFNLNNDYFYIEYDSIRKKSKRLVLLFGIVLILSGSLYQAKNGIINVYGYRAATSDTTEKAIETLNTVLDKVNESVKNK